jgi:hypothetical protein
MNRGAGAVVSGVMAAKDTDEHCRANEYELRWDHVQMGEWVDVVDPSFPKVLPPDIMIDFPS